MSDLVFAVVYELGCERRVGTFEAGSDLRDDNAEVVFMLRQSARKLLAVQGLTSPP